MKRAMRSNTTLFLLVLICFVPVVGAQEKSCGCQAAGETCYSLVGCGQQGDMNPPGCAAITEEGICNSTSFLCKGDDRVVKCQWTKACKELDCPDGWKKEAGCASTCQPNPDPNCGVLICSKRTGAVKVFKVFNCGTGDEVNMNS